MQTWNIGDTIAAKNSKAQVIAADGKGWVKVRHNGQEYEGYQVDFEAKGWRKRPSSSALGGCLTLLVILFGFGGCTAMLAGNAPSPKPLTIAEKYQQNLMTHTEGFVASATVKELNAETLYANHKNVCKAIASGEKLGLSLDATKAYLADTLQKQHGYDNELARHMADGVIDGALAWGCN